MTQLSKGFSITELLVTVSIVGILSSIAIPNYIKYKKSAHDSLVKSELSEISKFLLLSHSLDNGYHQYLGATGYRPTNNLSVGAGFKKGSATSPPCCSIFPNPNNASLSPPNDSDFHKFNHIKHKIKAKSIGVHAAAVCSDLTNCSPEVFLEPGTSFSAMGVQGGGCSFSISDAWCDCDQFTIVGGTAYGKDVSGKQDLDHSKDHGIFAMDQNGKICKADSQGKFQPD